MKRADRHRPRHMRPSLTRRAFRRAFAGSYLPIAIASALIDLALPPFVSPLVKMLLDSAQRFVDAYEHEKAAEGEPAGRA